MRPWALILAVGEVPATYVAASIMIVLALAAVLPIHAAPDLERLATTAKGETRRSRSGTSPLQTARDLLAMPHARLIVLMFAGQLIVGFSVSLTVTVKEQAFVLPAPSVTWNVFVVVPFGKTEPLASPAICVVIAPGQLSVPTGAV